MDDISPEVRQRLEENRRQAEADFWWKYLIVAFIVCAIIGYLME